MKLHLEAWRKKGQNWPLFNRCQQTNKCILNLSSRYRHGEPLVYTRSPRYAVRGFGPTPSGSVRKLTSKNDTARQDLLFLVQNESLMVSACFIQQGKHLGARRLRKEQAANSSGKVATTPRSLHR